MTIKNDKTFMSESGDIDVNRLVLVTAISAAFRIFVAGILIFILFIGLFPLTAMNFFEKLGLSNRALDMLNIYIAREKDKSVSANSGYADGLYHKIILSQELYFESSGKRAEKLLGEIYDSTYKYLQIEGIEQKNKNIDAENLEEFAPFAHANVFSFADRVSNLNYFAAIRLGKNEFLIGSQKYSLSDIVSKLEEITASRIKADFEEDGKLPVAVLELNIFFGQLSEYIGYNISQNNKDVFLLNSFVSLMDVLEKKIEIFEDFAFSYCDTFMGVDDASVLYAKQTQLYLLRRLGIIYDYMQEAAELVNYQKEQWDALRKAKDTEDDTVYEYYYKTALIEYIAYFEKL